MNQNTLLIKPVGGLCHLRCSYCFYWSDHHEKSATMSLPTIERIAQDWLPKAKNPYVVWQGGEPTLWGFEQFKRADEMLGEGCLHSLQTSATLLSKEWVEWLAARSDRWGVGVSLDGPKEHHDARRKDAKGKGTFDETWRGVELLEEAGVPFGFVCVVQPGIEPMALHDFFQPLDRDTKFLMELHGSEESARAWLELVRFLMRRGERRWLSRRAVSPLYELRSRLWGMDPGDCRFMPQCDSYAVVDWNGEVYPCDHFVSDEMRAGNLWDKPLSEILQTSRALRDFSQRKRKTFKGTACGSCASSPACKAGCPAHGHETPQERAWCTAIAEGVARPMKLPPPPKPLLEVLEAKP